MQFSFNGNDIKDFSQKKEEKQETEAQQNKEEEGKVKVYEEIKSGKKTYTEDYSEKNRNDAKMSKNMVKNIISIVLCCLGLFNFPLFPVSILCFIGSIINSIICLTRKDKSKADKIINIITLCSSVILAIAISVITIFVLTILKDAPIIHLNT